MRQLFRRRWPVVVGVSGAVAGVVLGVLLLVPNQFSASIALVPHTRSSPATSQLAGLAALAGVSLGAPGASESPQFYATLLTSRPTVYALLQRRFAGPGGDSAALIDLFDVGGGTAAERRWRAARKLMARTGVSTDLKTNIIRVSVEMPSPQLAADVANAYADELNRFNRETRQSQASQRRQFVEQQVVDAERELADAEGAVRTFLERNRTYEVSPTLQFELTRLQRAHTVRSELYLDLRRQLDAARIAEVDDVPLLTLLEPAIVPARKSGPHRLRWVLSAFVGTMALVVFWFVSASDELGAQEGTDGAGRPPQGAT